MFVKLVVRCGSCRKRYDFTTDPSVADYIVKTDDGGCGDPECCGGRTEWTEFRSTCPHCNFPINFRIG